MRPWTALLALSLGVLVVQAPAFGGGPTPPVPQMGAPLEQVPPVRVRGQVGFDARGRATIANSWTPVTLWIENNTNEPLQGELRLSGQQISGAAGSVAVKVPVRVSPVSVGIVRTAVFLSASDGRLEVSLTPSTNHPAYSNWMPTMMRPALTRLIVVLDQQRTGDAPAYPHDELGRGELWDTHHLAPAYPPLASLPERWIAYESVHAFVVADPRLVDQLSLTQQDALRNWAVAGGRLVFEAATPEAAIACEKGTWAPLLPGRFKLQGLSGLADQSPFGEGASASRSYPRVPLEPSRSQVAPDGTTLPAGQPRPFPSDPSYDSLAAQRRYGLGNITLLGFSLADPQLHRQRSLASRIVGQVVGNEAEVASAPFDGEDGRRLAADLEQLFKADMMAQIPSHRSLLLFLVCYCLLLAPLNRIFFSRLGRPLLGWVAIPVIVAVFAAIALKSFAVYWPEEPSVREVSVVQAPSQTAKGVARSFLCLFSPYPASYRMELPDDQSWLRYLSFTQRRGLERETLRYVDGVPSSQLDLTAKPDDVTRAAVFRLEELAMSPNSTVALEASRIVPLKMGVQVTADRAGKGRTVVVNRTSLSLDGGVLYSNGKVFRAPPLAPDETWEPTEQTPTLSGTAADLVSKIVGTSRSDAKLLTAVVEPVLLKKGDPCLIAWVRTSVASIKPVAVRRGAEDAGQTRAITFLVVNGERSGQP